MEQTIIRAFDTLTTEEIETMIPDSMTFDFPADKMRQIQVGVLQKLRAAEEHKSLAVAKGRHTVKALLIAAVVVVLLAASAMAVYFSGGSRFLSQLFGEENFKKVENSVLNDIAQVSDENISLTLESALSDGHYYYVVFSVTSLNGRNIAELFPDVTFQFTREVQSRIQPAFQIERLETEENSDTHTVYTALIRSDELIQSMKMDLTRLFSMNSSAEAIDCALSVETDFLPCPIASGGIPDGKFRNIELSPFGLWIDVFEAWENSDALASGLPIYDVSIEFKDGSVTGATVAQFADFAYLESIGWGGMQLPNGTHQSLISIRFSGFIDTATVQSVTIDGVKIPVSIEQ